MKTVSTILSLILFANIQTSIAAAPPLFEPSQYKGKVIYLDFWASWCIPCRKSFPWLNKIHGEYKAEDLVIVAVNLDKEKTLATEFLLKYPADFKIIYDPKGNLAKKFKIKGMPSSIIFGKDGKPKFAHKGFFSSKITEYENEIKQLIEEQ